jgi:hypothetical protein
VPPTVIEPTNLPILLLYTGRDRHASETHFVHPALNLVGNWDHEPVHSFIIVVYDYDACAKTTDFFLSNSTNRTNCWPRDLA